VPIGKAALVQAAKDDHRPVAQLVEKLLIEWLEQAGYLPWSTVTAPSSRAGKGYRKEVS
jgi:hypothetical protein